MIGSTTASITMRLMRMKKKTTIRTKLMTTMRTMETTSPPTRKDTVGGQPEDN